MRSFACSLLLAAAALAVAPTARADAVPPAPRNCPDGSVGETGHFGPYCRPATCAGDGDCATYGPNFTCQPTSLCIEIVTYEDWNGEVYEVPTVTGTCGPDAECPPNATCDSSPKCVSGPGPTTSSASSGAGPGAGGGATVGVTNGATTGAGVGGAEGDTGGGEEPRRIEGCGCALPGAGSGAGAASLAGLALLLGARLRRRRRAS